MPGNAYYTPTYFAPTYFGGLGSPAPPTTTTNAPDPNETFWTLGFGGATWDRVIVPGFALALSATLRNNGEPVAFTSGATLDAAVWPGGGEPASFAPAVAWDADDGGYAVGVLSLAISASQSATLKEGDYRLQVGVTSSGVRSIAFDGAFHVRGTTGSASVRTPYITLADLKILWDQIDTVANRSSDTAGFTTILAHVSDDFDRKLVRRYSPLPGDIRTRRNVPDPIVGLDVSDPTATWPSKKSVTDALARGGLVVDRSAWDILVRYALALILGRQGASPDFGGNRAPTNLAQTAAAFMEEAEEMWRCYQAQVSFANPATATPDALIDRGAILLPAGTSP